VDVVVTFLDGTRVTRVNVPANQQILISGQIDDATPPTTPTNVTPIGESESQIGLSWSAAADPESGVSFYTVYRNGVNVGTTSQTQFTDSGLAEATTYAYLVAATNTAGLEGAKSAGVNGTTLADTTPPALSSVSALNDTTVTVRFSEPVGQASAQSPANYSINNGIVVDTFSLSPDLKTVTLTTSSHSPGTTYTITVNNVRDRAASPNTILPGSQGIYVFGEIDPDLISYWTFDEGSGPALEDTVGTNQGTLVDMDAATAWVPGQQGTGLHFDGINDSVVISNFDPPHTGTITFWMNPDVVPDSGRQRIMGGHDAYELILEAGEIHSQFFAEGSQDLAGTSQLSPNQWYHIAATYDFTSTHILEIFINGVLEASNSFADDDPGGPFALSFGTRTGRSEYYQGILDNVRIYDRVLTGAEVVQVMQAEEPNTDPLPAFQVEASFGLYQDTSDGAAGLKVDISRAVERSTGDDAQVRSGGFQFQLTYDGSCVNILDIRPSSFPGVSGNINNSGGMATFEDLDPSGVPLPAELGHLLTRLVGQASERCAVEMAITGLVNDEGSPIGVVPPSLTQDLQRGDARADGGIGVADALYIAQHLTGLRPDCAAASDVTCTHSVNAASANNDGDFDRLTIADAQLIAEFLMGLRSEDFNLKP
jgi:chitodextrinase